MGWSLVLWVVWGQLLITRPVVWWFSLRGPDPTVLERAVARAVSETLKFCVEGEPSLTSTTSPPACWSWCRSLVAEWGLVWH